MNIAFVRSQWMWLAQSMVVSIGWLLIMFGWGGTTALRNIVAIYVAISGWSLGLNTIAQFIGWNKVGREWERVIASPTTLIEYLLGLTLAMQPYNILFLAVSIAIAYLLSIDVARTLIVFAIVNAASIILGATLSLSIVLRIKQPTNISAITNPLLTLTTFLPPVYYPPTILPHHIKNGCIGIPTVALVDLTRYMLGIEYFYPPITSSVSIILWLAVSAILTAKVLKWGYE